ncbi:4303_t:CDS:2, partial [Dentiscutata heterogama]
NYAMREAYKNDIQVARKSNQFSLHVFSFDFAQNEKLPYNPQQLERWYYLLLLKVHQFGLVNEGIDHHWHTLYTEKKALKGTSEIKGHTQNSVDCGFGNTKKEYAKLEVWCIDQLVNVINRSATNNVAVNLEDQAGPFHDWTSMLSSLYYKPLAIQKYYFTSLDLLKQNIHIESLYPQELLPKGLPEEKQIDLWNNIHPYCLIAFCDKYCLKPDKDM